MALNTAGLRKFVQNNWKGAVVGAAVFAAAAYGGPIAGKAVGFILPKALDHVSNTPVEDVIAKIHKTDKPAEIKLTPLATPLLTPRATLEDVARDWNIKGRLDCRVVQR